MYSKIQKFVTQIIKSTSTTEVVGVFSAIPGFQAVVRSLSILPTHAADSQKFYIAKAEYEGRVNGGGTNSTTTIYLPVDVAGGHVFKGHTLTTSDYVLVADSGGLKLRVIASVVDDSAKLYCHITVAALASAPAAGQKIWIVRAADIDTYVSGGTSRVEFTDRVAGNVGAPLAISCTSNGSNNNIATANVEYVEANV